MDQKNGKGGERAGHYRGKLIAAFNRLKSSKESEFHFIVCDAKPHCALAISEQRISSTHKAELTEVTGGSKRFLQEGKCRFENGKLLLDMQNPPSGLAARLKKSLKHFTGLAVGVAVAGQPDEDEDAPLSANAGAPESPPVGTSRTGAQFGQEQDDRLAGEVASAAVPPRTPEKATLEKAPEVWHQTRDFMKTKIGQLKTAILTEFTGEGDELLAEIERNMTKLDRILGNLDHRLADSLGKAHATNNAPARKAELNKAKVVLADYIKYVKSEPLITHIDSNPFGIKTDFKPLLVGKLTHMAQAIG
jgi:hypothetical protein